MPVVAWHRAQERDALLGAPRSRAAHHALEQRPGDAVVHQGETRIVTDKDLRGRRLQHRREQRARFGQALQHAVVARVVAGLRGVVAVARQGEHGVRQRELVRRGLAASHVEFQTAGAKRVVVGARGGVGSGDVGLRSGREVGACHEAGPMEGSGCDVTGDGL